MQIVYFCDEFLAPIAVEILFIVVTKALRQAQGDKTIKRLQRIAGIAPEINSG